MEKLEQDLLEEIRIEQENASATVRRAVRGVRRRSNDA